VCELDRNSHTLQVWNGGNPDIVIRHGDGAITRIASTGTPIAADRFTEPSHPIITHDVAPGDRIFAFSDGLVEVRDRRGHMLGLDHLVDVVRSGEAGTVFPRLLGCIPEFTGMLGYDDDISVVEVIV
jgi:serine phosphatase RsbU (regulator of sigma subunit)